MGLGMEIGVDLGTSSVLVYIRGKGIVLKEPSVVAVNSKTGKVLAVGESASLMLGRTPGIVEAIRPLREGVISDFRATEVMLKAFIGRVCTGLLRCAATSAPHLPGSTYRPMPAAPRCRGRCARSRSGACGSSIFPGSFAR